MRATHSLVLGLSWLGLLAFLPQGTQAETTSNTNSYPYWVRSDNWGEYTSCYHNGDWSAMVGACSSGGGRRCRVTSSNAQRSHSIYCETPLIVDNADGWTWFHHTTKKECVDQVAVGICAGGKEKDCDHGDSKDHNAIRCADLSGRAQFAIYGAYNGWKGCEDRDGGKPMIPDCLCPDGYYVTGVCGSGSGRDCAADDGTNYYSAFQCRKVVCKAGYDPTNGCADCGSGYYSEMNTNGDNSGCTACPTGNKCPETVNAAPTTCEAGKYQDETGQASCKPCDPGTVAPSTGYSIPDDCLAGTYSNDERTQCLSCPNNGEYYSLDKAGSCSECPDGTVANQYKTGCDDVNECTENTHGCPDNSACVNKDRDQSSTDSDPKYVCRCDAGYAVRGTNGASIEGDDNIVCEIVPIQLETLSRTATTITVKLEHEVLDPAKAKDVYLGCFEDLVDGRMWSSSYRRLDLNSFQLCLEHCRDISMKYAGLEYSGDHCYCSNRYPHNPESNQCTSSCPDDSTKKCGGFRAMSVYTNTMLLGEYDLHVGRYESGSSDPIIGSPLTKNTWELEHWEGVTVTSLIPGNIYLFDLKAVDEEGSITRWQAQTSCECEVGGSDAPADFVPEQKKGLVLFKFNDQSQCEEGFAFTRNLPNHPREVFTSTYYYAAACNEAIEQSKQTADDLSLSRLDVGVAHTYCVQAVGAGNAGQRYASSFACEDVVVEWEASIEGIVQLAPHSGSLPVEGVTVSWELISSSGSQIVDQGNSVVTGPSGRYSIYFKSDDTDLFTVNGVNKEVEVRIRYSKTSDTTSGEPLYHKFMCDGGKHDCSAGGNHYTSVFLRHLDFDVMHSAIDTSTVPITGKVVIADTGPSVNSNLMQFDPLYHTIAEGNECPLIGADVCLKVYDADADMFLSEASHCVKTDSQGEFGIGAPLGTTVKVEVQYHDHDFILDHDDYAGTNDADEGEGIAIQEGVVYEGFNFLDVQKVSLKTLVFGGLCERLLGEAQVVVKLPSCDTYPGALYTQAGILQEHYVIAHAVLVEVQIKDRHDIDFVGQNIDMTDESDLAESKTPLLGDESNTTEIQDAQQDEEEGVDMLRFQYDGTMEITVTATNDFASGYCKEHRGNVFDDPGDTLLVLPAYRPFVLIVNAEQSFGDENIANCDQLPEDTKVYIESMVGATAIQNQDDAAFLQRLSDQDESEQLIAEYSKCSAQDKENEECTFPQCCNLDIGYTEGRTGDDLEINSTTTSDSRVEVILRAGPPLTVDPELGDPLKYIHINVAGVQYQVAVLVVGDYDNGVPVRYPLPATDPLMILRDPPGGSSYAYYENVKTTTEVEMKGVDEYGGFDLGFSLGTGVEAGSTVCAMPVGFGSCYKALDSSFDKNAGTDSKASWTTKYKDNTFEASFTTTWSYQTSAEPMYAGHLSDVFVVPSLSLILHPVIEVGFNISSCHPTREEKVKFSAENDQENALSFLTTDGVNQMTTDLKETREGLAGMDHELAPGYLELVDDAISKWDEIMTAYEGVNEFEDANLINPSKWFEEVASDDCKFNNMDKCPNKHFSSLMPEELKNKLKKRTRDDSELDRKTKKEFDNTLDGFDNVQIVSFSGGGGEFHYRLDKAYSNDWGSLAGNHDDNEQEEHEYGGGVEAEQVIFGPMLKLEASLKLLGGGVKTHFKHDISADESSMGFVLSDPDVGDHFDVKIGIDPTYGSFVFKTVGGISKCDHEENTERREIPAVNLISKPRPKFSPIDRPFLEFSFSTSEQS